MTKTREVPIVEYLKLSPSGPYLSANECKDCGARFFDRRNACAACGGRTFRKARVRNTGTLESFSIVHRAAPGIAVPYVSAIVDCGGTTVRSNLVNCEPDPAVVTPGMKVRLTTYPVGTDDHNSTAIAFGYEPVRATKGASR